MKGRVFSPGQGAPSGRFNRLLTAQVNKAFSGGRDVTVVPTRAMVRVDAQVTEPILSPRLEGWRPSPVARRAIAEHGPVGGSLSVCLRTGLVAC